jgi:hypothetical protein
MDNSFSSDDVLVGRNDILSSDFWKDTPAFKQIAEKLTQRKYYEKNGAPKEVLQLVEMEPKQFGSSVENLVRQQFQLGPRTCSENDATLDNVKIEIKAARYWAGKNNCRWQHLEETHDFEYALFVLLDFHRLIVWGIPKNILFGRLRTEKIVTPQGKQGFWTTKNEVLPYLKEIDSIHMLKNQLHQLPPLPIIILDDTEEEDFFEME